MLILERPYCGIKGKKTELSPGFAAHLKRTRLGALHDASGMPYSQQRPLISESVAAGVAH